jgi:hypothetical protein
MAERRLRNNIKKKSGKRMQEYAQKIKGRKASSFVGKREHGRGRRDRGERNRRERDLEKEKIGKGKAGKRGGHWVEKEEEGGRRQSH